MLNPWFADERKAMIEQWIESQDAGLKIDIVTIEDINDPLIGWNMQNSSMVKVLVSSMK